MIYKVQDVVDINESVDNPPRAFVNPNTPAGSLPVADPNAFGEKGKAKAEISGRCPSYKHVITSKS